MLQKYISIEEHVNSEQHKLHVQDTNFETLDHLINKYPLYNCLPVPVIEQINIDNPSVNSAHISHVDNNDVPCAEGDKGCVDFSVSSVLKCVVPFEEGVVPFEEGSNDCGGLDDGNVNNCVATVGVLNYVKNCEVESKVIRKFTCPNCKKEIVNLPWHMQKIHGWILANSKVVVGQFGLRKCVPFQVVIMFSKVLYPCTSLQSTMLREVLKKRKV